MFAQTQSNKVNYGDAPKSPGAPPTPLTLNRAMSRAEELNERLYKLGESVREIALAIGGPWPTADCAANPAAAAPALTVLNESIDRSHDHISDIEQAVFAIRRSLEG